MNSSCMTRSKNRRACRALRLFCHRFSPLGPKRPSLACYPAHSEQHLNRSEVSVVLEWKDKVLPPSTYFRSNSSEWFRVGPLGGCSCYIPPWNSTGALDEGSWCRTSILRNIYVALSNLRNAVEFKKLPCPMSLSFQISCHMSLEPKRPHVALWILGV